MVNLVPEMFDKVTGLVNKAKKDADKKAAADAAVDAAIDATVSE